LGGHLVWEEVHVKQEEVQGGRPSKFPPEFRRDTVAMVLNKGTKIKMGQLRGLEMSIAKLSFTNNLWRADFVAEMLGPRLKADTGEWGTYSWHQLLGGIPGMKVDYGTEEVMKNIVTEARVGPAEGSGQRLQDPFREP